MKAIYLIIISIWISIYSIAQVPQKITLTDDEQKNFWDSTTIMIIVAAIILVLILARGWAKSIRKKRDELAENDKNSQ
jgi:heme/copper-type cytochrome/quinol oxidase subunit 2